jgi:hypothetical protein
MKLKSQITSNKDIVNQFDKEMVVKAKKENAIGGKASQF